MASREIKVEMDLSFRTRDEQPFRALHVDSVTYICPFCGDRKAEALDVCHDPGNRCRDDA